jgi:hypothetical protein
MTDRYVIVYRDGNGIGPPLEKDLSDWLLANGPKGPAYRIRIREKASKPRVNPFITDWRQLMSIAAKRLASNP